MVDTLDLAYGRITELVGGLSDRDLLAATRCHGWGVAEVLNHLLHDAQRALVAFATPHPGPADRDSVSYWAAFGAADSSTRGTWSVKRSTAAFMNGRGAVMLWQQTAPAAVRAAARADGYVTTQGHVLTVPDFVATLVTEAVIHHLDLIVHLPDAPAPDPAALAVAVETLDGLLARKAAGVARPAGWSAEDYVLCATGRERVTGPLSELLPLLS
ncbi:MAG TPA: maleylpyruvate isomerase N-terminal domain-containing protein [Micromonosporaceae bacterium]|jgi:uncharacterized protein (TIGR03083 family)